MFYEKFETLCRQFKLDPISAEGDIANVFFNLGVKYALKEQTSQPVLTTPTTLETIDVLSKAYQRLASVGLIENDADTKVHIKDMMGSLAFVDNQEVDFEFVNSPDDLTQADIQSLSSTLNKILNSFELHLKACDRSINVLWDACDINKKGDPIVDQYYQMLNDWKENKRDIKEKYKKFAAIQRKLKILMKIA